MSLLARVIPLAPKVEQPAPSEQQPVARPKAAGWFSWFVAACLTLLAFNAHRQLQIQERLLDGSRELETVVARSRVVSGQTNEQLDSLRELDGATAAMDGKLARLFLTNRAIRMELDSLDRTVAALLEAVAAMDDQSGRSRDLLGQIHAESAALHATLLNSKAAGDTVSRHLSALVRLQEAVTADIAEMADKTEVLDRFTEGG